MKIYLGSDHAGFELKKVLFNFLKQEGHHPVDMGPAEFDPADDYPDYILPVAEQVAGDPEARGIILGASGQGEAIVANRTRGARAVVYYGPNPITLQSGSSHDILVLSREHNDANILSLGARFLSSDAAKEAVRLWLQTPFSGEERHVRRLSKITSIEEDLNNG
jgi:ribose 5-phosphate isomerase B